MIIVMKPKATKQQIDHVVEKIKALGLKPMVSRGTERTIIGVIGSEDAVRVQPLEIFAGVEKVMPVLKPFKLVSRDFKPQNSVIDVDGLKVGDKRLVVMAGPCSVENRQMLMTSAKAAKRAGAHVLRGGAFKPRTSPYSFQGLGEEALKYLREAADATGLKVVTEVMDVRDVGIVSKYADILQIGARNMQNFNLLTEAGQAHKPVLLKRGLSATITEFLLAAEYILSRGNFDVMLCERGIRAFEDQTRFTLDLSAVPVIKKLSHLPIIVDPSHATGYWDYVGSMAKAAVAAGADGLIIDIPPTPETAMSDGPQSLLPEKFVALAKELKKVAAAVGRTL